MSIQTLCRSARTIIPAILALTFALTPGLAQEPQKPGKEHKRLKAMVGTWDCVVKSPGSPDSKGTAVYRMACRGMWLQSDFDGEMGGEKFKGKGMDSWDAAAQKYVSVWFDSMSGTPLTFYGNYDESGKVLTMHAESKGPDGTEMKWKSVSTEVDADHMNFKLSMITPDGAETEVIGMEYTRRPVDPNAASEPKKSADTKKPADTKKSEGTK